MALYRLWRREVSVTASDALLWAIEKAEDNAEMFEGGSHPEDEGLARLNRERAKALDLLLGRLEGDTDDDRLASVDKRYLRHLRTCEDYAVDLGLVKRTDWERRRGALMSDRSKTTIGAFTFPTICPACDRHWTKCYCDPPSPADAPRLPSLSHAQLLSVVQRLPQDHGGYGDDDRPHNPQCVEGCRWYHPLEGPRGMDWGVCGNPESHRSGLLTFEHQGCGHFELAEVFELEDEQGDG